MITEACTAFKAFCDPAWRQYRLDSPFVRDHWLCAIDGRAAIMRPISDPDTEVDGKVPDVVKIIQDKHLGNHQWQPWPDTVLVNHSLEDCETCDGSGFESQEECPECHGDGETECFECGHTDDCDECDGAGKIGSGKCAACSGERKTMQPFSCRIGSLLISHKYENAIRTLPNAEFSETLEAILFRGSDGTVGVVMRITE